MGADLTVSAIALGAILVYTFWRFVLQKAI